MESMYLAHRIFSRRNPLAHQTGEYHFCKISMHTGHTRGRGEGGEKTSDFQQNIEVSERTIGVILAGYNYLNQCVDFFNSLENEILEMLLFTVIVYYEQHNLRN